jgi:hypothetical protein
MAKWCNEGETWAGNILLKGSAQTTKYLGLYKDADEPAEDATLSTITEVTVAFDYARIALSDGDWTEGGTKGVFTNLEKTFTANGGAFGAVTGSFITTTASGTAGKLLAVEHFADGVHNIADGASQKVTPVITIT